MHKARLLVPVLEDGRQARQEVLDGRRHARHADDVDDALERAQDAAQHLRVLLAQVLVQHHAQVAQQLLLVARLRARGVRSLSGSCSRDTGALAEGCPKA